VQRASDDRKALMREIVDTLQAMPRDRS